MEMGIDTAAIMIPEKCPVLNNPFYIFLMLIKAVFS